MNQPRRHPAIHNCLLVAAGAAAGCAATLTVQYFQIGRELSSAAVSAPESRASPARVSALNRWAGDQSVKLTQILSADDREHKADDLRRLGKEAAEANQKTALELAASMSSEADRASFMRGVMEAMAERDPSAAAAFAQTHFSPGAQQAESMRIALGAWGTTSPRDAYAWAEANLSGPVKEEAINALVQSWAGKSPDTAARWFVETGSTSPALLTSLAGAWATKSPREAAQWVETLPNKGNQEVGRVAVAREWASQNPAEAADHYAAVVSAPLKDKTDTPSGLNLATVLADIWGTSNPAAAAKWITQLPAGPGREQAAATLATVWAASDMPAAVQWSASLTDPVIRAAAVDHIATTWGAIEPDKAIAWLDTQPADIAASGYQGAWNSWAATDPAGLQNWIEQMPAGVQSDLARRSLADVTSAADPAAALDLALGMSPDVQPDAVGRYFRVWRRSDDAAAQDWLTQNWNILPAATRGRMEREQQRPLR